MPDRVGIVVDGAKGLGNSLPSVILLALTLGDNVLLRWLTEYARRWILGFI